MRELYGSTEGNVVFLNLDGTIGSIGQMPPWIGTKIGMEIVKFDVVDEQPEHHYRRPHAPLAANAPVLTAAHTDAGPKVRAKYKQQRQKP